jgi:hypothetical protein
VRRAKAETTKRVSVPRIPRPDATIALLDQVVDLPDAEPAAYDSSISAAALRDWPEIAGDVDEWVREHGGRGDAEQNT